MKNINKDGITYHLRRGGMRDRYFNRLSEKDFLNGKFLSKKQKKYKKAISWLLNNSSETARQGKSLLMCFCFIKFAINNPNVKVFVFDHFPTKQMEGWIIKRIRYITPGTILKNFDLGRDWIMYNLNPKPLYAWQIKYSIK